MNRFPYDDWVDSLGVPVYREYYIADIRTLELGYWSERGCNTAFIQLSGQEGISEARVTEVAARESLQPYSIALDEIVYVMSGTGVAEIRRPDGASVSSFEWREHSMFMVPRGCTLALSSLTSLEDARLLHYNYLPLGMSVVPDAGLFLHHGGHSQVRVVVDAAEFGAPRLEESGQGMRWISHSSSAPAYWYGRFFPDMRAWDKLENHAGRGAGGRVVRIQFTNSEMSSHMSVFPSRTYKKAHRHGPGRVITIPRGSGYSVMWEDGGEKRVFPWQQGSLIVPPDRWFHQHFNTGSEPARYLAFHPPIQFHGYGDGGSGAAKDQIEYTDEDPWIRSYFETQLAERGLVSSMPEEVYTDPDHVWRPQS